MRLSTTKENEQDQSEITVYRTFVAKMMSIQKQPDEIYNGDLSTCANNY